MNEKDIVLCALDFSDLARQELSLGVEVCQALGWHLLLHHNVAYVAPGFTRVWEWNEVHRGDGVSHAAAEKRLRELLAELPDGFTREANITAGPTVPTLLHLAENLPVRLIILGSHGWSTPDHASLTERVLDACPCPVLTLNDSNDASHFRLRVHDDEKPIRVAVAIDLSPASRWPLEQAFELALRLPALRLDLVHVLPAESTHEAAGQAHRELEKLVCAELADRTSAYVQQGDPIDAILQLTRALDSTLLVMGEHARSFFRRVFTRDTARGMLHSASCPVWFVPPKPD